MGHLRLRYDRETFSFQVDKLHSINIKNLTLNKHTKIPRKYTEIPTTLQILNQNIINIEVILNSPELLKKKLTSNFQMSILLFILTSRT